MTPFIGKNFLTNRRFFNQLQRQRSRVEIIRPNQANGYS